MYDRAIPSMSSSVEHSRWSTFLGSASLLGTASVYLFAFYPWRFDTVALMIPLVIVVPTTVVAACTCIFLALRSADGPPKTVWVAQALSGCAALLLLLLLKFIA
jgi:hypothetical protein